MYRAGVIPSLDKEGWRDAPGWFDAGIPQLRSDSYSSLPSPQFLIRQWLKKSCAQLSMK